MVVDEVGGSTHIKRGLRGVLHLQLVGFSAHGSIGFHVGAALCRQSRLNSFLVNPLNDGGERISVCFHLQRELTLVRDGEIERFLPVGFHVDGHDTIGQRSQRTAHIPHATGAVGCGAQGSIEVELTVVATHIRMTEVEHQAAHGEEPHAMRTFDKLTVDDVLRRFLLTFENQRAHFVQMLERRRAVVVMWPTAPEGFLIELNLLHSRSTEHHGTHTRVAKRQCLQPAGGRMVIPKTVLGYDGTAKAQDT